MKSHGKVIEYNISHGNSWKVSCKFFPTICMQQMQYNSPNLINVFKNYSMGDTAGSSFNTETHNRQSLRPLLLQNPGYVPKISREYVMENANYEGHEKVVEIVGYTRVGTCMLLTLLTS